ncbi:MAG: MFS transporter [Candidatus Bathyarchaeia archaeon]
MSEDKHKESSPVKNLHGTLNRDLKLILLANFVGAFGDGLYFYLLPLYIRSLEAGPVEVGIFFSVLCLTAAITPILGGILADRYDRKKVMILGWLIWIPVPLIFSLVEHWTQMLPAAVLYGCWIGQPAASAYVATSADRKKMTLTFTMISAAWWSGYIFSPTLGGYLSKYAFGMRHVFLLSFVFYSLCTIILLFISSQHTQTQQSPPTSQTPFRRKMLLWSLFFAVIMFVQIIVRPAVPQFLDDIYGFDEFHIGILASITFFGSTLLTMWLGRVGDRHTRTGAVSISMILCFISLAILVSFNNFMTLILASFLLGSSYSAWSVVSALFGSVAPEATRGRWMSLQQTAGMLAAFFAPYLGGMLYEAWPYNPFIVAMVATPLLAALALTRPFQERP